LRKLAEGACPERRRMRGWLGYYALSECYRPIPELDHWLRRRVRLVSPKLVVQRRRMLLPAFARSYGAAGWKQWRWCRTRVHELLKLGTFLRTAIHAGLSRKAESDETRPRCIGRNLLALVEDTGDAIGDDQPMAGRTRISLHQVEAKRNRV
jgi:hypothetical protein